MKLVHYTVCAVFILILTALNIEAARRFASYMDAVEHITKVLEQIEVNTRK